MYLFVEIAIHYALQLIFIATSSGQIHRINISENTRTTRNMSMSMAALTVDWLHDFLYVASASTVGTSKSTVCFYQWLVSFALFGPKKDARNKILAPISRTLQKDGRFDLFNMRFDSIEMFVIWFWKWFNFPKLKTLPVLLRKFEFKILKWNLSDKIFHFMLFHIQRYFVISEYIWNLYNYYFEIFKLDLIFIKANPGLAQKSLCTPTNIPSLCFVFSFHGNLFIFIFVVLFC